MQKEHIDEIAKCWRSPAYFINSHCKILDATAGEWIPFTLWPEQRQALKAMHDHDRVIILKARQLGLSWLVLSYGLWLMLFRPQASILLFSRRDDEAVYLLDERMKGIYKNLPEFMRAGITVRKDSGHIWELSNGSISRAFPTTGGDSYQATLAVCDEFDIVQNQNEMMRSVKPTIDAGGKLVLVSRADKGRPNTPFKATYRGAVKGVNGWTPVFLPWRVRPERDAAWYEDKKAEVMSRTGGLDELHEQYPATDIEALNPRTVDKRVPPAWIMQCYEDVPALTVDDVPSVPGLLVYQEPIAGSTYVIGADPAEGNPTSDDSAFDVICVETGEQVATCAGKFEPSVFSSYIDEAGRWYNDAAVLPERNNHGHAVIGWLRDNSYLYILKGYDGKDGWLNNSKGKALLYTELADSLREQAITIHNMDTYTQVASIEASTLRAPSGDHDDKADALALANIAQVQQIKQGGSLFAFGGL